MSSQSQKILEALREARGKEVSLVELSRLSGSFAVSERCSDLRTGKVDGIRHDVRNRVEPRKDGTKASFYWLIEPSPAPAKQFKAELF